MGGVSEGPTRGSRRGAICVGEPPRSWAVEGIPVCGMAASFAGRRRNAGLGRSVRRKRVSSPLGARTGDSGCPEGAEEGNDVRMGSSKRMHRAREAFASHAPAVDASFSWSSDPCTSIATATSSGQPGGGGALKSISRSGKPGGSQEEPAPGSSPADRARLAACHRFRKEGSVMRKKRKGVTALVPARIVRARAECPFVVRQLQKSAGDVWPQISSSNALQKERSGASERGPRSVRASAVTRRRAPRAKRRIATRVASDHNGARPGKGPG